MSLGTVHKRLIDSSIHEMSPEDIAEGIGVELSEVHQYLVECNEPKEEPLELLEDEHDCFKLSISLQRNGNGTLTIWWPKLQDMKDYTDNVAKLLYMMNNGMLRNNCMQRLVEFAHNQDAKLEVRDVIKRWREMESEGSYDPIVDPTKVLG